MKRNVNRFLLTACVVFVAAGFILPVINKLRSKPSILVITPGQTSWKKITVHSANLESPVSFVPSSSPVHLSPVRHGEYVLHVEFSDGQSVWATFFHSDAGARRTVEILLERDAMDGTIKFRQTANKTKVLFEGKVNASETSEKKPFQLDGI